MTVLKKHLYFHLSLIFVFLFGCGWFWIFFCAGRAVFCGSGVGRGVGGRKGGSKGGGDSKSGIDGCGGCVGSDGGSCKLMCAFS